MMIDGGIVFIIVLLAGVIAYIKGLKEKKDAKDKHNQEMSEAFEHWYRNHYHPKGD